MENMLKVITGEASKFYKRKTKTERSKIMHKYA